ncbi:MAG: osmoprotectant transport system permease protein [Pseudonocardiales bacterium]|jgi:osmoprotectant transport system permease protein|nr:osmoprotectant transport system permease protein [Pseudonocardiales bacterium]
MSFWAQVGQFFVHNYALLLSEAGHQIVLALLAVCTATVIALPIGVTVGHLHRWSFLAISGGNALRALPTLAIVAIGIGIYGLGYVNIWVALVVLALPLILTNTYVAVDGVSHEMVEAARGMGMNAWQIVTRVELPSAVPLIMAGIRTATVYVIATAYLAGFAGSPGTLGDIITNPGSYQLAGVLAASVVAVALAFLAELVLGVAQRALTPRGLSYLRDDHHPTPDAPATPTTTAASAAA